MKEAFGALIISALLFIFAIYCFIGETERSGNSSVMAFFVAGAIFTTPLAFLSLTVALDELGRKRR